MPVNKFILNKRTPPLILAAIVLVSFCQDPGSDYERDLRLVLTAGKFGVMKDDIIDVAIKNVSQDRFHRVMYKDSKVGFLPATYISFSAFMVSKGKWVQLKSKYEKRLGFYFPTEMRPVKINAGKSLAVYETIIDPKKWFEITSKGQMKLVAHYKFLQLDTKTTKDTTALKIPSFHLNSDTIILNVQ